MNLGLVNRGWFLVRLYHLSKRKTNFAFRTIKIRPAMVEISQKNIIASHGLSGRLAGRLEKYLLKLHGLSKPTLLFKPSKSNMKWLRYDQKNCIASHDISGRLAGG